MFTLTPEAIDRIIELKLEHGNDSRVRLAIAGGGCSGMNYVYSMDEKQEDDFEFDDSVIIDPASMMYLNDATMTFIDELWNRRFAINNPNVSHQCGCGSSFAP